jgi:site-specific recombinase XerD
VELLGSRARSLRAANGSQGTIDAYMRDTSLFVEHMDERDSLTASRRDVEDFLATGRDAGLADATVARRYRSLLQFFRWAEDEGEIDGNPMAKMRPPKVAEVPPPTIRDDQFTKLIEACRGERVNGEPRRTRHNKATASKGRDFDFEAHRDEAMLRLLWTTRIRAGALIGMTKEMVDLNAAVFPVVGKGNRARIVALMPDAADAVDRYLRTRRKHPAAKSPQLSLGRKGAMTDSGLRQLLERRSVDAEIDPINPHRFRHTFAHRAKSRGMADDAIMQVAGWRSSQMVQRYGASAAAERAREQHRKLFGGDSL